MLAFVLPLLGLAVVLQLVFRVYQTLWEVFFIKPTDLPKVFGKGSWIIVTGSTASIGYEFCLQLAAQGFNLIMLGRDSKKLKEKSAQIKAAHKNVQIQTIVADFTKDTSYEFYENILSEIQADDVSVLINCVGNDCGTLKDESIETIRDSLVTNFFPTTFFTRAFVFKHKPSATKNKGVINISCHCSELETTKKTIFNSAKRGVQMFSEGENNAFTGKGVYLFAISPVNIVTEKNNKKRDFLTCTPSELVKDSLESFTQIDNSFGCKRFIAYGHMSELIRNWFGMTAASYWRDLTQYLATYFKMK